MFLVCPSLNVFLLSFSSVRLFLLVSKAHQKEVRRIDKLRVKSERRRKNVRGNTGRRGGNPACWGWGGVDGGWWNEREKEEEGEWERWKREEDKRVEKTKGKMKRRQRWEREREKRKM